jgi:DNA replication protein DnaC
MSELVRDRLESNLTRLGLLTLKEALTSTLDTAQKEAWAYSDRLDRLFEDELANRESRRVRNALKLSGIPAMKTLDSFDFAFQPSLKKARIAELASLGFLENKENVLLLGPPGVGKTHLAIALAVKACQCGFSVYFTTLDDLVKNLASAEAAGKLKQKLRTYTHKSALLVVDEVGYLPLSRREANYLFQLVSARYERSSLILTSNKSFTEWSEMMGDEVIAAAILDRLLHHSHVISIRGQSYRLRDKLTTAAAAPLLPTTLEPAGTAPKGAKNQS